MIAPEVSVALAVGVACVLCGAAGILGYVLDQTDAPARIGKAVRRWWRETAEAETQDWLDCGDDDGRPFDVHADEMLRVVACCPRFPDCVHDTAMRAALGDPDAPAHAATPESFRAWLHAHGLEEV